MAKTVSLSKHQEWKGLDRIQHITHEMGCIFREMGKDDVGIDGEIEIVVAKADGKGTEATGGVIKVQAKSGMSYVRRDSDVGFVAPIDRNDLEYWYSSNFPVVFIVYHPTDDKLYWKEIKPLVRATPGIFQPPCFIPFDKTQDEFALPSYERLCQVASVSPPRVSRQDRERLYSNLLLVKRTPQVLTHASTDHTDYTHARHAISGFVHPFCIVNGQLYTLADLRNPQCGLRSLCNAEQISDLPVDMWLKDEVRRRDYVFLLNQLLGIHLHRCGLRYNRQYRRNYFPRENDVAMEFRRNWFNVRTGRSAPARLVAKYYKYGVYRFWRHLAVELSFQQLGTSWFLQVTPKYFFTEDGYLPCDPDLVGPYTTRQKAMERNIHVLNHVLFWADILSMGQPTIEFKLDYRPVMVIEKEPLSGVANFAIPHDPAVYQEEDGSQLNFLGDLFAVEEDTDDYEY